MHAPEIQNPEDRQRAREWLTTMRDLFRRHLDEPGLDPQFRQVAETGADCYDTALLMLCGRESP